MDYIGRGIEVIEFDTPLAQGSLMGCRVKFARSTQRTAIEQVVKELEGGGIYLGDWNKGEIEIVGINQILTTRYWILVVYDVLFPPRHGTEPARGTYQNIRWNVGLEAGAGALLLTSSQEVVLVRSFRHAKRAWTLELPRGVRHPGESLQACALREAQEECGARLTSSSEIIPLCVVDSDTGVIAQRTPIFAITHVEVDAGHVSRDVSESVLGPVVLSISTFYQMVNSGAITDGWIQSAVLQGLVRGLLAPPSLVGVYLAL